MRLSASMTALRALVLGAAFVALTQSAAAQQEKRAINPPGLPDNLPFSNGIMVGDILWVAGVEGVVNGNIEDETRTALESIKKIVTTAGLTMADIVQVTVYLKNIDDFPKMNAVYRTYFPDPKPTRTTIGVARLVNDALIEITSVAVRTKH